VRRRSNPGAAGKPWLRTTIAASLVAAAGLAVTYTATDGFQAYTLESARRLAALRSPAPVPDLRLEVLGEGEVRLSDMGAEVVLVDFIYTRCQTYCSALGSVYAQLGERLAPEIAAGSVRLLSISFDPAHDGPRELLDYRNRYSRDATGWHVARPGDAAEVRRWLDAFGVVVIGDGMGGYTHNAAVHVVGPQRRLAAIHDLQDVDGVVRATRRILESGSTHVAAR
jgi:protein SCO1/2